MADGLPLVFDVGRIRETSTLDGVAMGAVTPAAGNFTSGSFTGQVLFTGGAQAVVMRSAIPTIEWDEEDAAADNQRWQWRCESGTLRLQALTDASAGGGNLLDIQRSGNSLTAFRFGLSTNPVFIADETNDLVSVKGSMLVSATPANGVLTINSVVPRVQILSSGAIAGSLIGRFSANALPAAIYGIKSRSTTVGTSTIVNSSDGILTIAGYAADGTDFDAEVASIRMLAGTVSGTTIPGHVDLYTANSSGVATRAWRVNEAQRLLLGTITDDGTNLAQFAGSLSLATGSAYKINNVQVVIARITGWATATGTPTRTTFDTATVTLPELAARVKALIDDLHATAGHGLIGT